VTQSVLRAYIDSQPVLRVRFEGGITESTEMTAEKVTVDPMLPQLVTPESDDDRVFSIGSESFGTLLRVKLSHYKVT
jgi:hypothetical protein